MNSQWQQRLGLRHAVVQAGMGGGLSTSPLAGAVSAAGGLGTVGIMPPDEFAAELRHTRTLAGDAPFAANLLMPFVRSAHVDACLDERPDVVVMFYGHDAVLVRRLQDAGITVWHQVGNVAQAQRALADDVDGLIAQGIEAGGHLAGAVPLAELLPAVRAIAGDLPVLAAGGIFDAASAAAARRLGASGVVAGTRFLMTPESNAHPEYLARLLAAQDTVRTLLFGLAWPAYHRVVPNAAVQRWCRTRDEGPRWLQWLNTLSIPTRRFVPLSQVVGMTTLQRLALPFYTAAGKTKTMERSSVDLTPLYAGVCVRDIDSLRPAAAIVAELARGFGD